MYGSPRTGRGGANLGLHCDASSRGHLSCCETPPGALPTQVQPQVCSPRWGLYVCVRVMPHPYSHQSTPLIKKGSGHGHGQQAFDEKSLLRKCEQFWVNGSDLFGGQTQEFRGGVGSAAPGGDGEAAPGDTACGDAAHPRARGRPVHPERRPSPPRARATVQTARGSTAHHPDRTGRRGPTPLAATAFPLCNTGSNTDIRASRAPALGAAAADGRATAPAAHPRGG